MVVEVTELFIVKFSVAVESQPFTAPPGKKALYVPDDNRVVPFQV